MQPLEGIRIADFSHVMAGPFATHLLRLPGAEVIKVEPPGRGDPMRFYGNDRRYDGMSPAFIGVNVGKKSIVLNLKKPVALSASERSWSAMRSERTPIWPCCIWPQRSSPSER